nr:Chain P, Peptide from Outer membrane protein A [Escherichia coli K-12]
NGMLSLGVS